MNKARFLSHREEKNVDVLVKSSFNPFQQQCRSSVNFSSIGPVPIVIPAKIVESSDNLLFATQISRILKSFQSKYIEHL